MAKHGHFAEKAVFCLAQIVDQNVPHTNDCEIIVKMLQTKQENCKKKSQPNLKAR